MPMSALTDISVVIPSFGGADTIRRAVETSFSQARGNVRVIVVIDDDCDTTEKTLQDMNDARIEILRNERNSGAPVSRNRGLARVTTSFVTFLDCDDFYDGDFLAPLVEAMKAHSADIGFGPSIYWTPQRGYENRRVPTYRDSKDVFVKWLGQRINVNTAAIVWRTDYVREIGGWDEALGRNQDGDIALRAILNGARFAQSSSGAGVYSNEDFRSRFRISTRTDNLSSLLRVVDKFLGSKSNVVPDSARIAACAEYCLVIAHLAYSNAQDVIGDEAMARRQALGFKNHRGDLAHILSVSSRFVPKGPRMAFWRSFRASREFVLRIKSKLVNGKRSR